MSFVRPVLSLAAAVAALAAAPAAACSLIAGYHPPTNLELAAAADAIVLGQVVDGSAAASSRLLGGR